jgi:hypothetical protein
MPIQWTISKPTRLVIAVCKGAVTRQDIEGYLDAVVVADVMSYRKIFDGTHGQPALSDADMMELGARIRAYATTGEMGPLAIVAGTPEGFQRAHLFVALSEARRPIKIFQELHEARQWLDAEAPSP